MFRLRHLVLISTTVLVIAVAGPGRVNAQAASTTQSDPPTSDSQEKRDCSRSAMRPSVASVSVVDYQAKAVVGEEKTASDAPVTVKLRDTIEVTVNNLAVLRNELACAREQDKNKKKDVVLFLDDRPLIDVTTYPPSDPDSNTLRFPLMRTEASREVWKHVLGKPSLHPHLVRVSVGIQDEAAIDEGQPVQFDALPKAWLAAWTILLIFLMGSFLVLANKSNLLRDNGLVNHPEIRRVFSLARVQGACWFFVILASYLFIGLVTGDYSTTITSTVLVLLGISAGTTVGSAFVDASKATPEDDQAREAAAVQLDAEIKQVDTDLKAAQAAWDKIKADPAATATDKVAAAKALSNVTTLKAMKVSQLKTLLRQSESFVIDILSDANGVSFHRFQIAAWTIVLTVIFIVEVYRELAMPEFSDTLLGLMGISSGTFIGLKIPEATVPKK